MPVLRLELPCDHAAIREVNRLAFAADEEVLLVDRLRADGQVIASLVALVNEEIVGHILFSHLDVRAGERGIPAASLAPMAVTPEWQRRGIGSALVRAGLQACRECGKQIVIVVGHPEYYPRFGFSAELARGLACPFPGARDAWMALELTPGVLTGATATVRYPEAFGVFEA